MGRANTHRTDAKRGTRRPKPGIYANRELAVLEGFTGDERNTQVNIAYRTDGTAQFEVLYHGLCVSALRETPDGREIEMWSGGWATATTARRIGQAARLYGLELATYILRKRLYVVDELNIAHDVTIEPFIWEDHKGTRHAEGTERTREMEENHNGKI